MQIATRRQVIITAVLLFSTTVAIAASDYAREKKWEDEIAPGIVVGDAVHLKQKNGHRFLSIYTGANNARMGVVIVHGVGRHPDIGLISVLRQRLPDFGYATLSIQMPILAADARSVDYARLLQTPDARERLQLAVAWLKAKGHQRIAVVSHSLGSRMTHGYMVGNPPEVSAWAALGTGTGPGPMITYDGIRVPVLDLYGANELPPVLAGAASRKASLQGKAGSRQIVISDTDHFFTGHDGDMVAAVKDFLDSISGAQPVDSDDKRLPDLKALSVDEVQGFLTGKGTGLAKVAELNRYPGPAHVLELAGALQLSEDQTRRARAIFDAMQKAAVRNGEVLVDSERDLDRQFASGTVTPESLQIALKKIAESYAAVRGVHLRAHIDLHAVLTPDQIAVYDSLRGHAPDKTPAVDGSHTDAHR